MVDWDKLSTIELHLRMYVHGWDIEDWQDALDSEKDNIYECPDDHGHNPTLDQSFAWTLADRLKGILELKNEKLMEDFLKETFMMYATFKRQKNNYPILFQLAKDIYRACHKKE